MGNQRQYNPDGGFSEYLYVSLSEKVTINGVTGRLIAKADNFGKNDGNLPTYSNTSDIYFRQNMDKQVVQAKVYISRDMVLDFDWSHQHINKPSGEKFPIGTIHVQVYRKKGDKEFVRLSNKARRMTEAEKEKYGPIIRYFNPSVIL